ncbi:restriction endonuclease subunit S [Gardnerella piotii]|uniref:restriction endonuclease subunit S n=1 Tax=Gardnerella piotii TaxID=2792977 RepID=UPI003CE4EC7C
MTSRLEELIAELCPNGVEYKKIGDIADVKTGKSNGNEAEEDGLYPFFVRSENIKRKNDWEYDEEAIIIPGEGGIGDIYHYIKGKYALHQRVYRVHFEEPIVNTRFAYYYFKSNFKRFIIRKAVSATVTSIRKPMIEDFEIPVPPLEVQAEIVQILDTFTELTAELAAELTARKKQYEYYRDTLLTFDDNNPLHSLIQRYCPNGVEYKKIGEIAFISTGSKLSDIQESPSLYEYINAGTTNSGYSLDWNCDGDVVTTPSRGQGGIGYVGYQKNKFWLGPLCYKIAGNADFVLNKYLYYCLSNNSYAILSLKKDGGVPAINKSDLEELILPVPPLEVQRQIVQILDRFDALCNDLTQGLPAEIEARRKQYEYYRDQLLTFKRA